VRSYTRHQLKENAFAETTADTISWAVEHRSKLIAGLIVVALLAAAALGIWAYLNYRNQQANEELSSALQKYNAPLRPAGEPASPEILSYASSAERAKAANAEFSIVADKYRFTRNGRMARYFAGVTLHDLGNNEGAERQLHIVAESRDSEVASLAKLALASIDQDAGKTQQAIQLYKSLIEHPTTSVGKTTAQFSLANLYEADHQPLEARKLYEQMQKSDPTGPVGQMAAQKLQTLRPPQP
jgi:predicted negative regulator of RcsB-dependent stress response